MKILGRILAALVVAYLLLCAGGVVYDNLTVMKVENPMVGHAPGGITFGGYMFLRGLMPVLDGMLFLCVFAVLMIIALCGEGAHGAVRAWRGY